MRSLRSVSAFLVGLLAIVLVGCAGAASPLPSSAQARPASSPAGSSSAAASVPAAWLAVGRVGKPGVQVILAKTAELVFDLPAGAPTSADWRRIVSATFDGAATVVRDEAVQPDLGGPDLRLDGAWRLPTVGSDVIPAGVSTDGSTIALVEERPDTARATSRFTILQHDRLGARTTAGDAPLRLVRTITLLGSFEYDALSPDGSILYVVEHLDGTVAGRYQVRAVDVASGVMREEVIADKSNLGEAMAGWPVTQLRRPDGVVLTLYRGRDHPFIHALNSKEAWAVCIDLPATAHYDAASAQDWGLAESPAGAAVFAINATLGLVVDVDPAALQVRRTASIATTAGAPIVLAKFGHEPVGPVGRRIVVAPDGAIAYAAGSDGIVAIDLRSLSVVRHDLAGSTVAALGLTPDGATMFVLSRDGGRIVALDAASGRSRGSVPGRGYDRLLAVAPW